LKCFRRSHLAEKIDMDDLMNIILVGLDVSYGPLISIYEGMKDSRGFLLIILRKTKVRS